MMPDSTGGVYVNYAGDADTETVAAAYGQANYARLVALKNKLDPTNLFRHNHNIRPTG
jgi:FAD/FMN-containing dehydrogenase